MLYAPLTRDSSLRKDKAALAQLREKLFIMWGDLEELKSSGASLPLAVGAKSGVASNNPFECCIHEYGVPAHPEAEPEDSSESWERMHRMFGTTIM